MQVETQQKHIEHLERHIKISKQAADGLERNLCAIQTNLEKGIATRIEKCGQLEEVVSIPKKELEQIAKNLGDKRRAMQTSLAMIKNLYLENKEKTKPTDGAVKRE